MPIYEYQCQACGEITEALQKMSDPHLTRCPVCHEEALRKKVSAAAFRLKGGGWYETDFKTDNRKNIAGGEGKDDGKKSAGDDGAGGKAGGDGKTDSAGAPAAKDKSGKDAAGSSSSGKGKPTGGSSSAA